MRTCKICMEEKQLEGFPKRIKVRGNGTEYSYYESTCKSCKERAKYLRRKASPVAYEKMKARARVRNKKAYQENPEKVWGRTKKWVKQQIESGTFKDKWLVNKYKITIDDYNRMRIEQDYSCKICKTSEEELGYLLHVDHCHDGGHVRGLLCVGCNTSIGKFKHNPEILKAAIEYLS